MLRRNPITGIVGCCARAGSGHAAAPPSSVMNRRRSARSIAVMGSGSKRAHRREHYLIEIERGIAPASGQSISPSELPERYPL